MKRCGRIRLIALFVPALALAPAAYAQLLNEPLQGSTTGTRSGGVFVAGGWQITDQYDAIYWHTPVLAHGAYEFNLKGLPAGTCTGSGNNELCHMYDYTYNNADNSYAPGYQDDPYKQYLRKRCDIMDTMKPLWQIGANFLEPTTAALSWDVNHTYLFRVEWQNTGGNAVCNTYRDGVLLITETLPGSWSPGGQSIRIGASTRRAGEGATVGSIYSNVKVFDLGCSTAPPAPSITSPANGEITRASIAFVQWSGSSSMYQVRINTANDPNAGTVWDSQQVTSTRSFSWTGSLSNANYYAFVRVGCGTNTWSPWSSGRAFTVNTAYVPPGANVVKIKGNSLCDNNGPFLGLGFSHFRALQRCKYDRTRYQSDLAFMQSKGFRYQRALSMVAWDGLEIAPVSFTGPTHAVAAWPDYDQQLKDAIDIAYDTYGIRTELTIFADAEWVMPSDSTRMSHLDRVLADLVGREHKIAHLEVANEYWQNGFPDPGGVADVQSKGLYLANHTSIPVALSSPSDTSDAGIVNMYTGTAADLATVHFSRDTSTNEDGWLPVHDCFRTGVAGVPPMSSNEPIGPGSSVSSENDPLRLCMAGVFAWTANLPSYVFHAKAGIQGWTGCCPPSGTEQFFQSTSGVDGYLAALAILPPDLPSWERSDGKDVNSPFTNYSGGLANKWWTENTGSNTGCIRHTAAFKGADFVSCPIGIQSGGVDIAARRSMSLTIYNALTGAVVSNLVKNANDHFTLTPSPAPAYIIKGTFTDVAGLCNNASIDLGNPDVEAGITNTQNSDGDTTPATIGGRSCKRNVNAAEDFYFYFNVSDSFTFNGSSPDLYISVDYYDSGTSSIGLQYDSIGPNPTDFYKSAGSVALTNTNTWKSHTWHVTDAYFGNRQNAGADFRFGDVGPTFYLDVVGVSAQPLVPPIIHPPTPNPEPWYVGVPYLRQLTLDQGQCPTPVWSVLQGPSGLVVSAAGQVSGWTPTAAQFGNNTIQIQAASSAGNNPATWVVRVLSRMDFDGDGDVDQNDFALMQRCFSGDSFAYPLGCSAEDFDHDGDVDSSDFAAFLPCMRGSDQIPGC